MTAKRKPWYEQRVCIRVCRNKKGQFAHCRRGQKPETICRRACREKTGEFTVCNGARYTIL